MIIARPSIFVYGTLMAPEVLKVLIGRVPEMSEPALLHSFCRHPVKDEVFPGMIPSKSDSQTKGLILNGLSEQEMKILDWFEGDEYTRHQVQVTIGGTPSSTLHDAECYVWSNPRSELDLEKTWDYGCFRTTKLDWYLSTTVRPCRIEIDDLGIGKRLSDNA